MADEHPGVSAAVPQATPRRRSFTPQLYRAARMSNNISAIASGNPPRVARRAKNVALCRALGRGVFWRWLWQ